MKGLLGKKIGMTQIFSEDGQRIPVTVIEAGPCPVLAVKEKSIQLGFDLVEKERRLKKSISGYFKKLNVTPQRFIREIPKEPNKEYKVGDQLKVDLFATGEFVNVSGTSRGLGFQGGMKRWGWKGQCQSHGSMSHRRVGSIGSSAEPSRVWKGHHLPGHMGDRRVKTENLRIVKVDLPNNLLLVKGAVPGHRNGYLIIEKARKKNLVASKS
ncbi:MAG: 50S ribosomal protein L3 [Candidatus Omnitrophica bacterium]|nr:50S ribosomal protein L3 [Candidatus Omnitrophota bacterium]